MRARPAAVAKFHVPIAPLREQHRIVAKIDSLSSKSKRAREHLDHIPRLVEKYKQAVLAAAFKGLLTKEWRSNGARTTDEGNFITVRQSVHQARKADHSLGRDEKTSQIMPDDELANQLAELSRTAELPASWRWSALGILFGVYVGATPSRKVPTYWGGDVPWVSSGEVAFCRVGSTHETISEAGLRYSSTRVHPVGTVLLGMIGEGKTRGQAAILDTVAANNQNCAAIRVSEAGYSPEYIYWYLWSVYEQTRRRGSGNNQPALNKDRVQRLTIPIAPPVEAAEIARRIESAFVWIDRLAAEATSARTLIDRLDQAVLGRAFRGELVPQDPNDEPASVLLERIRAERETVPAAKPRRGRARRS